ATPPSKSSAHNPHEATPLFTPSRSFPNKRSHAPCLTPPPRSDHAHRSKPRPLQLRFPVLAPLGPCHHYLAPPTQRPRPLFYRWLHPPELTGLHVFEQAALGQAALQSGGKRHGGRRRNRKLREAGTGNALTEVSGSDTGSAPAAPEVRQKPWKRLKNKRKPKQQDPKSHQCRRKYRADTPEVPREAASVPWKLPEVPRRRRRHVSLANQSAPPEDFSQWEAPLVAT
ncbi:uncharacterized protein LOC116241531, partial [Phasianus colchicus]|uniref:uncharacterized protein LOC116241531 n=1 Tax=Phasianus colchicus TaxID=9054 RepID=UPI00129DD513